MLAQHIAGGQLENQDSRGADPARYLRSSWILGSEDEPPLAAHIVSPRRGYLHHGIYVGGHRVVHYAGLAGGLRRGPVEEVSLERFARGRAVLVLSGESSRYDELEVIGRARSRIGEDAYRLFTNNCEHFCEWCLRGEPRSYQVEQLLSRLRFHLKPLPRLAEITSLREAGTLASTM